jgi:hypothetical protein
VLQGCSKTQRADRSGPWRAPADLQANTEPVEPAQGRAAERDALTAAGARRARWRPKRLRAEQEKSRAARVGSSVTASMPHCASSSPRLPRRSMCPN